MTKTANIKSGPQNGRGRQKGNKTRLVKGFKLPEYLDPRYTDYARANASIGINGTVLTNVNANATALTPEYLEKAAAYYKEIYQVDIGYRDVAGRIDFVLAKSLFCSEFAL